MKKIDKKKDRSDKFTYKKGDLKIIKSKPVKESYSSFAEFIFEKEEKFVASTMRWITIKDEKNQNQHILIKKKDGTILGGMGGTRNGEKLGDVFKDIEADRKEIEKKKEAKPYPKTKYDEIDPPSRERFEREMRVAKRIDSFFDSKILTDKEVHSKEYSLRREDLTTSERIAIESYTGEGYQDINGILRDHDGWRKDLEESLRLEAIHWNDMEDEDEIEQFVSSQIEEREAIAEDCIQNMVDVFDGIESKENMKTYRGLASEYFNDIKDKLKVGDFLEDNGFVSTSTDEDVAGKFGSYIMEVLIPKGSPAISVKSISGIAKENEVLLKSGARFEVCEINHEKRRLVAMLTYD